MLEIASKQRLWNKELANSWVLPPLLLVAYKRQSQAASNGWPKIMEIFELLLHWNSELCIVYCSSISYTAKYCATGRGLLVLVSAVLTCAPFFMQITLFYFC